MLYVGGLEETVTEALVHAAFVPFGPVKEVNMPMDPESSESCRTRRCWRLDPAGPCVGVLLMLATVFSVPPADFAAGHRGFAFVMFEDDDDAAEAKFNMDGAELHGRVLKVDVAKPSQGAGGKPAWEDADKWYAKLGVKDSGGGSSRAAAGRQAADDMLRAGPDAELAKGADGRGAVVRR